MRLIISFWLDHTICSQVVSLISALGIHLKYLLVVWLSPGWYFQSLLNQHTLHNVATGILLTLDEENSVDVQANLKKAIGKMISLTKVKQSSSQKNQLLHRPIQTEVAAAVAAMRLISADVTFYDKSATAVYSRCESALIQQVFLILLTNAREASKQYSPIVVYLSQVKNYLQVIIEDFGSGMSYFEKIQCTWFGWSTKQQGSGLGLASAKWIIEHYCGGRMYLRSDKSQGTRIICSFPLSENNQCRDLCQS